MTTYTGGCHCGKVRYQVALELEEVISCNCSRCEKQGLLLSFVPKEQFTLIQGKEDLTDYLFNKHSIRHAFCKTCGTQSFAEGVTFPQMAINVRCLDGIDLSTLTIKPFDGKAL